MKNVNHKILLLAFFGVVLVAPFLGIASVVGIHAATLAANARPEVFCLLLGLSSIAARISDGHLDLAKNAEEPGRKNSGKHLTAGGPLSSY